MRKEKTNPLGVFPAPTISQLETLLDERQNADRRQKQTVAVIKERRKQQRREEAREETTSGSIHNTDLFIAS